ncbi:hypothetical protein OsI_26495 [Oryza sativa Indica Group]|jgi:hypothetical protein|uniref:Uncharacterized protein n=3 Tax=Oryza TaxID=4527 RepID=Q69QX8_ORYSJ|nr:hypothetical protein OsI_26495 [Oryza sativa Indica Group]EEE67418.1 hypothetical protein OsJ_24756 [Oryza sativa Japonica Group]BAC15807.1 hypothetical protein [Oryza sativa Japonica Group]BAD31278.1 hypothetical protein [Oryza sativa Japonica Group]
MGDARQTGKHRPGDAPTNNGDDADLRETTRRWIGKKLKPMGVSGPRVVSWRNRFYVAVNWATTLVCGRDNIRIG